MSIAIATVAAIAPVAIADIPEPVTSEGKSRHRKGLTIASIATIRPDATGTRYRVPSQSGKGSYTVSIDPAPGSTWRCDCKDFEDRGQPCKHVYAVRISARREKDGDKPAASPETAIRERAKPGPKRPTYKQVWPAYNVAQTTEKHRLQVLLADLCRGIQEPPRKQGSKPGGRIPLSRADMVFAAAFKVYSTVSGRRFMCDLADAQQRGHIDKVPHFNSIFNYLENPELTPVLRAMIVESSRPLASVEDDFAADSSGFTTCRFESWYDHKYGIIRRQHAWVKVHIMVGVKTNVVTAVEIKGKDAQDAPQLPAMLATTAENFTMREVSCDKVYASLDNYAKIDGVGAMPYIPFKSIHTGAGGGLWAKMFHYYNFNRDEFLSHYHKRSNVETTFSMIKAKFGDYVRSKTDTAMVNEALCKVLCHNVCCLIQSTHELGIEAKFWMDEPETVAVESESPDDLMEAMAWI